MEDCAGEDDIRATTGGEVDDIRAADVDVVVIIVLDGNAVVCGGIIGVLVAV
jgi:hypothetical protein